MYDVDNANPSGKHPQITQRSRAAIKIHEPTRNNTKSSFGDFGFVIIRVI